MCQLNVRLSIKLLPHQPTYHSGQDKSCLKTSIIQEQRLATAFEHFSLHYSSEKLSLTWEGKPHEKNCMRVLIDNGCADCGGTASIRRY